MHSKRLACATLAILFALAPHPVFASEQAEVTAAVRQFFDNLSDKTLETALEACDSPVSILDEFPPHVWYGPTACADWWKAYNAYNQKSGITPESISLGDAWSVDVSGDRAYFVAPTTYGYSQHGTHVEEAHAVFTVALRKTGAGWRITSWAWSKH
jgi:ketosteroid isomerase-like protein